MATGSVKAVFPVGAESGQGGYCELPDGTLIQWGSVTVLNGSYTANDTFQIPFYNKNKVAISLCPTAATAGMDYGVNWSSLTTTNLSVGRTPNTADTTFYWTAIGRWKA